MVQKLSIKNKGFTILELVITFTLGVMIIGVILFSGVHMRRNLEMSSARMEILLDVRVVSSWMIKDIRAASKVEVSATLLGQLYSTSANELVLSTPTIDVSGEIVDGTFDYIAYFISGNSLFRVYDAAVGSSRNDKTKLISQHISGLTLSAGGVSLSSIADVTALKELEILVGFSMAKLGQNITDSLQSRVRLRNKIT